MLAMISLALAPLRGITDAIFRTTLATFFPGFDDAITPFLTTFQGNKVKSAKLADVLPQNNSILPITPQIISKDAEQFIVLATMLHDLGHDTVNLNLGCPYPMVANKGRGSGFLEHPNKLGRFLSQITKSPTQISVKVRLGRRNPDELLTLMPIFNELPLAEIIIHPRLGVQMYKGSVDLEYFSRCLAISQHPVVYNGDITNLPSFHLLQQRFPTINRWMIGRGAVANPFLAGMIKGQPLPAHPLKHLEQFHAELFNLYQRRLAGPGHLLGRMKGLWFYLSQPLADGDLLLKKIQKVKTIQQYRRLVAIFFKSTQPNFPSTPLDQTK